MPESLESLRASFDRSLRMEGKADRTLVLYVQSTLPFRRVACLEQIWRHSLTGSTAWRRRRVATVARCHAAAI
jgi:hypothetical protein